MNNDNASMFILTLMFFSIFSVTFALGGTVRKKLITMDCEDSGYFTSFGDTFTCQKVGTTTDIIKKAVVKELAGTE